MKKSRVTESHAQENDTPQRQYKNSMWVVWLLALGTFAAGTDSFVLAGILPKLSLSFHVSTGSAGQTITAFSLTYAVLAPVLATMTGRIARRTLLITALAIFVLANVLSALAPNYALLLVARGLAAAGMALYTPNASAVAVMLVPQAYRGRVLAIVLGGLNIATIFGVPIGTAIGENIGWRATLIFVALLGLAALIGLFLALPAVELPPQVALRQRFAPLGQIPILMVLAVTALAVSGSITVYTYIASSLLQTAQVTGVALAIILLVWGIGGTVGTVACGWATDRFGPVATLLVALPIMMIVLALLPMTMPIIVVGIFVFIWGIAAWAFTVPQQARLLKMVPALPTIIISLNSSSIYLGQALGAAIGGIALSNTGLAPRFLGFLGAIQVLFALVIAGASLLFQKYPRGKVKQIEVQH